MKDIIKKSPMGKNSYVHMGLNLMHFMHRDGTHIVYSPTLQMSDYGETFEEAKTAFKESLDIWLEYVGRFKTFEADLERLGWTTEDGSTYHPPKYDIDEIKKEFDIGPLDFFEEIHAA